MSVEDKSRWGNGRASAAPLARPLPVTDMDSEAYWTGGQEGALRLFRCQDCKYYVHPPTRFCPKCEGVNVEPEKVSGRGTVVTYTVNHKQWIAGLPERYVIALVSPVEQDDVRLVTNIVNCDPDAVQFGMPVKVLFEQHEDLWVPLFEPETN